jgi:hypothetical protein
VYRQLQLTGSPAAGELCFKSSLFQVVQTVLGALSVVLGGTLYIGHYLAMYSEGAPFWTGIVVSVAS